jgi:glycosyltransferase involved in cell wall biosynthesis
MWNIFKKKAKLSKINLLFAGHDLKFVNKIINHFKGIDNVEVKIDKWNGHAIHNETVSKSMLEWADVIFCEWCLGNAVWYSKNKLSHQKLYIRLHKQEINTDFINNVIWKNVEKIIFIAPMIKEIVESKINKLDNKSILIYNYVDSISLNKDKIDGSNFNLGVLGYIPTWKRPDLAVEILRLLVQNDKRYKLYIKGKKPEDLKWIWKKESERTYFENLYSFIEKNKLSDNVIFEPHGSDVDEWFRKVGYVISCSDIEGSHQAVPEGMASGAIPLISGGFYNDFGAAQLYPIKYCSSSIEDVVNKISFLNSNTEVRKKEEKFCTRFAHENFSLGKILSQYERLLLDNLAPRMENEYGIIPVIKNTRLLIYGDINLNILDGSTVWLTNLVNMLHGEYFQEPEIHVLSKFDIKKQINLNNIKELNKVKLIQPINLFNNPDIVRMDGNEVTGAIKKLDTKYKYDSIIIRGQNIMSEFSPDAEILNKVIAYSLHNLEDVKDTVLNCKYLACQTQILKDFYVDKGIPESKTFILPPLINSPKEEPSFKRTGFSLIYTGTLKDDYNSIEIIKCFDKVYESNKKFRMDIVMSKIYRKPQEFTDEIEALVKKHDLGELGVGIHTSLSKSEVAKMIQNADVGISWRKPRMDESKELSTKLLEYASLGKPMILNRNIVNTSIFGDDYPYYANSEKEYLEKLNLIFSDDDLYEKTSRRVYQASKKYSYEHVHKLTKKYFYANPNE